MLRDLILNHVTDCTEAELPILRDQLIELDIPFELFCAEVTGMMIESEMAIEVWEIDLAECGDPEENPHYHSWVEQLDLARRVLQHLEVMQSWSF